MPVPALLAGLLALSLAVAAWAGPSADSTLSAPKPSPTDSTGPAGLTDAPSRPLADPVGHLLPEPPAPPAAEALAVYLRAMADADYSKALFFIDLPSLRAYLLNRRMADLQKANPGLSSKDLEEVSTTFQTRELDPDRVKGILVSGWQAEGLKGMTWHVAGWLQPPAEPAATIAVVDTTAADDTPKRIFVGLRESEDGWLVAPDILEKVSEAMPRKPAEVPMPDPVKATVEAFWSAWMSGGTDAAWALMSPTHRARVTLEAFAAHHAEVTAKFGAVEEWKVEHVRQISADIMAIGLALRTRVPTQALMLFRLDPLKINWSLEDVQFRVVQQPASLAPASGAPSLSPPITPPITPPIDRPASSAAPTPYTPSFKTDLKTQF